MNAQVRRYRDLKVWAQAMDLVAERLSYLDLGKLEPALPLAAEVSRMQAGLTKSLKVRNLAPNT